MIVSFFIIVGVIITIAMLISDGLHHNWWDYIICPITGALAGFILGGLVLGCGIAIYNPDMENSSIVIESQMELVPIQDNTSIIGSRYIISGGHGYTYLFEDPVMGIQAQNVDRANGYIKYINENEKPYVVKWHWESKSGFAKDWFLHVSNDNYTFYIHEDSVINNIYFVDLE